jgi:predicted nucleotidyltransferase
MFANHEETVKNVTEVFSAREDVLALVLGGSIAHGYATPASDVDILIVVSGKEYDRRKREKSLLYYDTECCTWPEGYVDGKFIDERYLRLVSERGNEPTRYAFKDARILFSRSPEISSLISAVPVFPVQTKDVNARRFYAQMLAWKWYFYEGQKHGNAMLMHTATSNFILFSCRLILTHNELLYPYHKWMMKEVERANVKPDDIIGKFDALLSRKDGALMDQIAADLKKLHDWKVGDWDWPQYFSDDVETKWMSGDPYISDI